MKLLVAGCGFVGERLADSLHADGHDVTGLTHSADSSERLRRSKPWRIETCDLGDADAVMQAARQIGGVDAWVHCASSGKGGAEEYRRVYLNGINHLLEAFPSAFPIFTSSTSVYAQTDGSMVTESSAAESAKETARLLCEAEQLCLARGGGVARLAGIYGPGRSFILKNLLEGKAAIEVTPESPDGRWINQIHRDDAAAALAHIVKIKLGGICNVADDAPVLQRACLEKLAQLFSVPTPPERSPDPGRKRGWTHKRISNAHLRATGWTPRFPSYFEALHHDPDLASSILDLVFHEGAAPLPRAQNIVMIGLMGSGKSTVGRLVAHMLGFQLIDTDHLIVEAAGRSIPDIFATEGEAGFRQRESAALRSLLGRQHCVIATGGGIVTQPRNLPLLRHLGYTVWLEADAALLARRTAGNNDRPLLKGEEPPVVKLNRLLAERSPLYQQLADLRIQTDGLSQEESAYGVAESARIYFVRRRSLPAPSCPPI